MSTITWRMAGDTLTIECDIKPSDVANAKPSSTGRTRIVATSGPPRVVATIGGKPVSFLLNVVVPR